METTPPMITPELLNVQQTAQLLNIGRNRVYEMGNSKQLPCIRLGNSLRFPHQALLKWIEQQVQEAQ
ncbi:helix-turn-helix domain-containing protein [Deinococcus cavernae]|nr:helix-turn-helix domain-containing protein [Deinococcus cavernae]